jgi:hypothetical protein
MARTESKSLARLKQARDGGGGPVVVFPHCVLNSQAYLTLSGQAVRLLIDIAMQFNPKRKNNGMLLASRAYMFKNRGWTSSDQLNKAKQELLERSLICQTVQGMRPNKASWYGLTWLPLDEIDGLEIEARHWPRGAYAVWQQSPETKPKRAPPKKRLVRPTDQKEPE